MLALLMTCAALGCHDAPETYSADFENKPRQTEIADQRNESVEEANFEVFSHIQNYRITEFNFYPQQNMTCGHHSFGGLMFGEKRKPDSG